MEKFPHITNNNEHLEQIAASHENTYRQSFNVSKILEKIEALFSKANKLKSHIDQLRQEEAQLTIKEKNQEYSPIESRERKKKKYNSQETANPNREDNTGELIERLKKKNDMLELTEQLVANSHEYINKLKKQEQLAEDIKQMSGRMGKFRDNIMFVIDNNKDKQVRKEKIKNIAEEESNAIKEIYKRNNCEFGGGMNGLQTDYEEIGKIYCDRADIKLFLRQTAVERNWVALATELTSKDSYLSLDALRSIDNLPDLKDRDLENESSEWREFDTLTGQLISIHEDIDNQNDGLLTNFLFAEKATTRAVLYSAQSALTIIGEHLYDPEKKDLNKEEVKIAKEKIKEAFQIFKDKWQEKGYKADFKNSYQGQNLLQHAYLLWTDALSLLEKQEEYNQLPRGGHHGKKRREKLKGMNSPKEDMKIFYTQLKEYLQINLDFFEDVINMEDHQSDQYDYFDHVHHFDKQKRWSDQLRTTPLVKEWIETADKLYPRGIDYGKEISWQLTQIFNTYKKKILEPLYAISDNNNKEIDLYCERAKEKVNLLKLSTKTEISKFQAPEIEENLQSKSSTSAEIQPVPETHERSNVNNKRNEQLQKATQELEVIKKNINEAIKELQTKKNRLELYQNRLEIELQELKGKEVNQQKEIEQYFEGLSSETKEKQEINKKKRETIITHKREGKNSKKECFEQEVQAMDESIEAIIEEINEYTDQLATQKAEVSKIWVPSNDIKITEQDILSYKEKIQFHNEELISHLNKNEEKQKWLRNLREELVSLMNEQSALYGQYYEKTPKQLLDLREENYLQLMQNNWEILMKKWEISHNEILREVSSIWATKHGKQVEALQFLLKSILSIKSIEEKIIDLTSEMEEISEQRQVKLNHINRLNNDLAEIKNNPDQSEPKIFDLAQPSFVSWQKRLAGINKISRHIAEKKQLLAKTQQELKTINDHLQRWQR